MGGGLSQNGGFDASGRLSEEEEARAWLHAPPLIGTFSWGLPLQGAEGEEVRSRS